MESFVKWLSDNQKIILLFVVGVLVGYLACEKGVFISGGNGHVSVSSTSGDPLDDSIDISGQWVYVAEAIENKKLFSEDSCHQRSGAVTINYGGHYQLSLTGVRKQRTGCAEEAKLTTNVIWTSEAASLLVSEKRMFVWFSTADESTKRGRILVGIVPNATGKPDEMVGDMFYLNENDNTWFKAKITFFRKGNIEANKIEATWK